jgi:hypothetical protein
VSLFDRVFGVFSRREPKNPCVVAYDEARTPEEIERADEITRAWVSRVKTEITKAQARAEARIGKKVSHDN